MRIIETAIKPKYRIGQEVRVDAGICKITHIYYRTRHPWITETVNENPEITYMCEFKTKGLEKVGLRHGDEMTLMCGFTKVEYKESDIIEVVERKVFFGAFSIAQNEEYVKTLSKLRGDEIGKVIIDEFN